MYQRKKKQSKLSLSETIGSLSKKFPMPSTFLRIPAPSRFTSFILILSLILNLYLLLDFNLPYVPKSKLSRSTAFSTTRRHLVFAIASSSLSWRPREAYVRLWYSPNSTRAFAFLDRHVSESSFSPGDIPPVVISGDTSKFPYTFRGGLKSAIRVARVVKEVVERNESDVRWFVFGDDDTVFFVDNLVKTLSKYDHDRWFYIGSNSESYEQNVKYSFNMAFGGGGFAISYSLARVLAMVLDSCLMRYGHLYGSDSRIFSCLAELGVGLTHEPGFHQVDMRGNLFGMLAAHPLSPLRTFKPWRRGANIDSSHFMFNIREYPKNPCKRPTIFFLQSVTSDKRGILSDYTRHIDGNCLSGATKNLKRIRVFSRKRYLDIEQMKAPRRRCCNVLPSFNESVIINIRQCGMDELIASYV
ncbi:Transferring glycosyl group transferase [Quillaja saponaria]|uniref:Transferring glycosyl group transferase n=1 Tax=Quillaja saponaria TaxID=32244 RepID=A0AAD7KYL2_QUISA|nr:Transferring glycosyl group transferase [Quillaja saponaria]